MATQVIQVNPRADFQKGVEKAVEVLSAGGLIVFPTETVYGLAARADSPVAMNRLREVKDREASKGFTVHLARRSDAVMYVQEMPTLAARFIRKAWPGPLTLLLDVPDPSATPIMKGKDPSTVDAIFYNGTVGLRCPDDPVTRSILDKVDGPIVASSANAAGEAPPRTADEALRGLVGLFDLLVDSGPTRYSRPSTIVKVTGNEYKLVREGVLDAGILERMSVAHFLFVCTGNTCRSPMAAGLARKMLAEKLGCDVAALERHGVKIASAGISGGTGAATAGALRAMSQKGVDLSDHSSTALTPDLIHQADHIFVMTQAHYDSLLEMAPWAREKTSLLLEGQDVEDPIGCSDEEYVQCAEVIEKGLRRRLKEVAL